MKLHIEIEITPEEIPLATELLALLKEISSTSSVNKSIPILKNRIEVFRRLMARAEENPNAMTSISSDIVSFLKDTSAKQQNATSSQVSQSTNPDDDFFNAFMQEVFDNTRPPRKTVMPFFYLLTKLPEDVRENLMSKMLPELLKVLAMRRPLDCNRSEFVAYAESFAFLVQMECVSIPGAVMTIITMLGKTETRAAAVTMLTKTVQHSLKSLQEKCDPSKLQELRHCVQSLNDDIWKFDVHFVCQNMGWAIPQSQPQQQQSQQPAPKPIPQQQQQTQQTQQQTQPSSPSMLVAPTKLNASSIWNGHQQTVFTMCYDDVRDQLLSAGKDSSVLVWSKEGKVAERIEIGKHYACSMDLNANQGNLFLCGVAPQQSTVLPALILFNRENNHWKQTSLLERDNVKLISCVKTMSQDRNGNWFVTGEKVRGNGQATVDSVRVYDANSNQFDKLNPLSSYDEHTDIITCLSNHQKNPDIFFSGSRDSTVRVWDKRKPKCIAILHNPEISTKLASHDGMVTCLDTFDYFLVSGGLDKKILLWDLRKMDHQPIRSIGLDGTAILKSAIGPSAASAAISTRKSLYLLDFRSGELITPSTDKEAGRYHDLKWNFSRNTLFAAGDDKRIDVFEAK